MSILPVPRYLTPAEKARELEAWASAAQHGLADPGVRPLIARLNAIEGVCTVQCCIGHETTSLLSGGTRHVENGCVEMRLDQAAAARFYQGLDALAALPGCEDALISWRPGYQICAVWFQPGLMARFVDALVAILAPPPHARDEGAITNKVTSCR